MRERRTPKALPGFSGGRKPGRNKAEGGAEEEEEEEESSRRRDKKKAAQQKECLSQIPVHAGLRAANNWFLAGAGTGSMGLHELVRRKLDGSIMGEVHQGWRQGEEKEDMWK